MSDSISSTNSQTHSQAVIYLVDDDRNILTSVSIALETEGFTVQTFSDSEAGLKALLEQEPDLAVLDVKMPRLDGMELLTRLREKSSVPVIFLTSKDDEIDQVLGLRLGADDYVTKPFSQRLLIERIRAVLRRRSKKQSNNDSNSQHIITRGVLRLDQDRHDCSWKNQPIDLTVTEFLLLLALADKPGHVKNRDQLITAAYGDSIYVDDRTIDTHIKRLRKKFRDIDPEFDSIETLYGIGYRYKD